MENIKKIAIALVAVIFVFLLLGFTTKSNENAVQKQFLIMRVVEVTAGGNSAITIVNENGEMEKIALEKVKEDGLSKNLIKVNGKLNDFLDQGYQLVSTTGGGDNYVFVTTYVFAR